MITLASVVEGHGEVQALPILLRRLSSDLARGEALSTPTPFRLPRGKFTVARELEHAVAVAARRVTQGGGVLVLADADDDCPVQFAADLLPRCRAVAAGRSVAVVLAQREYEAWFLAALSSLAGHADVDSDAVARDGAEDVRDAKGRLQAAMPTVKYSETRHQPAFTQLMDLDQAMSCRSFRKLRTAVEQLLA